MFADEFVCQSCYKRCMEPACDSVIVPSDASGVLSGEKLERNSLDSIRNGPRVLTALVLWSRSNWEGCIYRTF